MAGLEPGRVVLVRYEGDEVWHERLVLHWVDGSEYVICTPDYDIYPERLDLGNEELSGVRYPLVPGAPVAGVGQIYAFAPRPTAAELAQLLEEGRQAARAERANRGLPGLPAAGAIPAIGVVPGAPVVGAPGVDAAGGAGGGPRAGVLRGGDPAGVRRGEGQPGEAGAVAAAAVAPAAPQGPRLAGPAGEWVLDEPLRGRKIGDAIAIPPGALTVDGRALVSIDQRTVTLRYLAPGSDIDKYMVARATELSADARTIAVSSSGQPRSFHECAQEVYTDPGTKMALSGPRTAYDQVQRATRRGGGGFVADHDRWVVESGINPHDRSVYEDQVLSKALQLALTVDGLNLPNLSSMELLLRRQQLIREVHAENPKQPRWEGWEHFLGIEEGKGSSSISPALKSHVASELSKEAAILKERRKARDARAADKGGGGDPKGSAEKGGK